MAEASAQGNVPTFKLVLVGDGGTGKVRTHFPLALALCRWRLKPAYAINKVIMVLLKRYES
jgi:GTPase SAR1 family protein